MNLWRSCKADVAALPSATSSRRTRAPDDRAQRSTSRTKRPATPLPRADGATHMEISSTVSALDLVRRLPCRQARHRAAPRRCGTRNAQTIAPPVLPVVRALPVTEPGAERVRRLRERLQAQRSPGRPIRRSEASQHYHAGEHATTRLGSRPRPGTRCRMGHLPQAHKVPFGLARGLRAVPEGTDIAATVGCLGARCGRRLPDGSTPASPQPPQPGSPGSRVRVVQRPAVVGRVSAKSRDLVSTSGRPGHADRPCAAGRVPVQRFSADGGEFELALEKTDEGGTTHASGKGALECATGSMIVWSEGAAE
jgi:hypothetical protein